MVLAIAAPLLGGVLVPVAARADGPGPSAGPGKHGKRAAAVALRTGAPASAVVRGRTYEWRFKITASGPGRPRRAVFRTTLPRSLAFVSGHRDCAAAGWTVFCDLGTVRKGQTVTGAIRVRVSGCARPGQTIRLRGSAAWGRARTARPFPAVRIARTAHLGHSTAAPKKPAAKKPGVKKPGVKKPGVKKPGVKKPGVKKPGVKKPGVKKPGVKKPAAKKPGVKKPGVKKPGVKTPAAVRRTSHVR
ncbi:hypothetical protein [Actinomadura mexicana]|uniref:DUF11 domain-containing protein n=1 Tax=Actinomadura mexicana TaxID=134959 RepID=A0A239A8M9_9ACTN|nr:hypothetical protein [Actinomadura mexicana]SNR91681.1 hypothetical protein SAMN06265355_108251 [Actinomadura mexicana]